jgi:uncharacterized protein YgiM (DUF1202 family)
MLKCLTALVLLCCSCTLFTPGSFSFLPPEPSESTPESTTIPLALRPTPLPTAVPLMVVGAHMRVQTAKGEFLNLREGAGKQFAVITMLKDGAHVTLLEGPTTADGYRWWRVRTSARREGWVVEVIDGLQTLVL